MKTLIFLLVAVHALCAVADPVPIVFWHGMGEIIQHVSNAAIPIHYYIFMIFE